MVEWLSQRHPLPFVRLLSPSIPLPSLPMVLIKLGIDFPLPLAHSAQQTAAAAAAAATHPHPHRHPHGGQTRADEAALSAPQTGSGDSAARADYQSAAAAMNSTRPTFAQRLQRRADGSLFYFHDAFFPSVSGERTDCRSG